MSPRPTRLKFGIQASLLRIKDAIGRINCIKLILISGLLNIPLAVNSLTLLDKAVFPGLPYSIFSDVFQELRSLHWLWPSQGAPPVSRCFSHNRGPIWKLQQRGPRGAGASSPNGGRGEIFYRKEMIRKDPSRLWSTLAGPRGKTKVGWDRRVFLEGRQRDRSSGLEGELG